MRNLKRALSLALASVMLLGMMVVGSSAKGIDDFTDKAEIVNQDAVAVTSAIGMFEGYEDGSFGPENVVTRAEMAVIICTMLYGAGVNVNQFAETSVFTDVPAWAQGYVNLCSSLGIVAGVGDGKFDPNATVTTAQAVLMLCRALGYFQSAADFGNDWMLAATAKGTALGLYGDLKLTANAGLTRDNVAELVFNALTKAVPVQYNELLGVYYNENQGIIYSLEFNYLQTLGYKNFDLVYKTDTETIYGRPATTWGTGSYNVKTDAGDTSKTDTLTEDGGLIASMVRMLDKDEIITVPNTPPPTPIPPAPMRTMCTRIWASPSATRPIMTGPSMSTARRSMTRAPMSLTPSMTTAWATTFLSGAKMLTISTPARAPSPRSMWTTLTPPSLWSPSTTTWARSPR